MSPEIGLVFVLLALLLLLIYISAQRDQTAGDDGGRVSTGTRLTTLLHIGHVNHLLCLSSLVCPLAHSGLWQRLYRFLSTSSDPPSLPGPPGHFLIGNLKELTYDHLPLHLTNLAQRYGNIYQLTCGKTRNH